MAKREKNPASDKTGNDTGVSLLVLGIVSVIFALWIPIVGIVLGTVSLVRVRKRNDLSGTVMAKAGKVLSIAGICIAVVNWILAIVLTFMTCTVDYRFQIAVIFDAVFKFSFCFYKVFRKICLRT